MWTASCYILPVKVFYRTGPHPIPAGEYGRMERIMKVQMGEKKFFRKTMFAAAALLGLLAFAGAPRASAEDYDKCQRRIARADHKLHEAVEHHGWNSRQADNARRNLHEARERCWNESHRWWDEDGHRWHSDRDWDDHDHDHDRH
jgi:hypothetical protein